MFLAQGREFDGNKLYASEILAILMQVHYRPFTESHQAPLGQIEFVCCEVVPCIKEMVLLSASCVRSEGQMRNESNAWPSFHLVLTLKVLCSEISPTSLTARSGLSLSLPRRALQIRRSWGR